MFVLGASGRDGSRAFEQSRAITNQLVDVEMPSPTHYGVVLYNQDAFPSAKFQDFPEKSQLKQHISRIAWPQGSSSYEKGVAKALEMFTLYGDPEAERLIVLFVNGKTAASEEEMKAIHDVLMRKRIQLVVVAIGNDVEGQKLRILAPNDKNIVRVGTTDGATQVSGKVSIIIVTGG